MIYVKKKKKNTLLHFIYPRARKLIEEVNCLHLQVKHGNFGSQQLLQVCVVVEGEKGSVPLIDLFHFLRKLDIPFLSYVVDIWSIIAFQMMDSCWQVEDSKMLMGLGMEKGPSC
jgi:hypothetical protein